MNIKKLKKVKTFGPQICYLEWKARNHDPASTKRMNKKVSQYVEHFYEPLINKYQNEFNDYSLKDKITITNDCPIWFFWWQGIDSKTPIVVKESLKSIKFFKEQHQVIVLSKKNIYDYVDLDPIIIKNIKTGNISLTHFSDVLRTELLYQYGGIWIDATVLLSAPLPEKIYEFPFYTIKHGLYSDWHVCEGKWSTFFMASCPHSFLFSFVRDAFLEYLKKYDIFIQYLLFDFIIAQGYHHIDTVQQEIDQVPENNTNVFFLGNHGCDEYEPNVFENLKTTIFKASYKQKFEKTTKNKKMTNFGYICDLSDR